MDSMVTPAKRRRLSCKTKEDIRRSFLLNNNEQLELLNFQLESEIETYQEELEKLENLETELKAHLQSDIDAFSKKYEKKLKNKFNPEESKFVSFPKLLQAKTDQEKECYQRIYQAEFLTFQQQHFETELQELNVKLEKHAQKVERRKEQLRDVMEKSGIKAAVKKDEKKDVVKQESKNLDVKRDFCQVTKKAMKDQVQLAKSRLQEIESYDVEIARIRKVIEEKEKKDCDITLKTASNMLTQDLEQLMTMFDFNRSELSTSWVSNSQKLSKIELDDIISQQLFRSWLLFFEQSNLQLKRENDALHLEIEHISSGLHYSDAAMQELRLVLESQLAQFSLLKDQINRSNSLSQVYEKFLTACEKQILTDGVEEMSITPKNEEQMAEEEEENTELEEELAGIKMLLECYKAQPKHVQDKVNTMCLEMKLKKQLDELKAGKHSGSVEKNLPQPPPTDTFFSDLQNCTKKVCREYELTLKSEEKTKNMVENSNRQNARLKRKEDSTTENIRLMEQTMKYQKIQKGYDEEKEKLYETIRGLQEDIQKNTEIISKSDAKEKINWEHLKKHHDEMEIRNSLLDASQRKLVETALLCKNQADEIHLIKHSKKDVEKFGLDDLKFQQGNAETLNKKLKEKLATVQRKLDKALNKPGPNSQANHDEMRKNIAKMKEKVRCPICHKNDKNAVLTKCMHAFCYECINKRYETRQRQCPKCGQKFSKNEFHKIYLV